MALMDLKVNQDNEVCQEEVFKGQLEKREKLDLLVKLDYLEDAETLVKTVCPVSMECQVNLENKVLDTLVALADQVPLEKKVKLENKEIKVPQAPMVYVDHLAHKENLDEMVEEEDLVLMERQVKRVNLVVLWLVLLVKMVYLDKLVTEANKVHRVLKVKQVFQETTRSDKRVRLD